MGFSEHAHQFGRQEHLVGILTTPTQPSVGAPAVVLLTAGLVGCTGPFRMYATIARHLAQRGISTLRMDVSGVGESALPMHESDPVARTLADAADGFELLARCCGAQKFVVGGLCSGADDAHAVASVDPRVTGVIAMDITAFRNSLQQARWYATRALNPARVARFGIRKLVATFNGQTDLASREQAGMGRPVQTRALIAAQTQANIERDVRYLCIFSGGSSSYYSEEGQFLSGLQLTDPEGAVTERWWPDCDHTYALKHDRHRLCVGISEWMQSTYLQRSSE